MRACNRKTIGSHLKSFWLPRIHADLKKFMARLQKKSSIRKIKLPQKFRVTRYVTIRRPKRYVFLSYDEKDENADYHLKCINIIKGIKEKNKNLVRSRWTKPGAITKPIKMRTNNGSCSTFSTTLSRLSVLHRLQGGMCWAGYQLSQDFT